MHNDWRRKSPDTDTKKETKEMEPRKRQIKWNVHRLLFLQVFFYLNSLYALLLALFCPKFYLFNANKSRSWSHPGLPTEERKRQKEIEQTSIGCYFFQLFLPYFNLRIS